MRFFAGGKENRLIAGESPCRGRIALSRRLSMTQNRAKRKQESPPQSASKNHRRKAQAKTTAKRKQKPPQKAAENAKRNRIIPLFCKTFPFRLTQSLTKLHGERTLAVTESHRIGCWGCRTNRKSDITAGQEFHFAQSFLILPHCTPNRTVCQANLCLDLPGFRRNPRLFRGKKGRGESFLRKDGRKSARFF